MIPDNENEWPHRLSSFSFADKQVFESEQQRLFKLHDCSVQHHGMQKMSLNKPETIRFHFNFLRTGH